MRARAAATVAERDRMAAALPPAGLAVQDSCANFLLVDLGEPAAPVSNRLLEQGLVVRTFADPLLATHIRISPATPADDDALLRGARGQGGERRAAGRDADRRRRAPHGRDRRPLPRRARRLRTVGGGDGIGMLDHMLTALSTHSLIDLELTCTGDLWVDEHHTVEDVAIVLGQALDDALGDRAGIARFGDARAPLDEALAHATVDLGGRGVAAIDLPFAGDRIGALPGHPRAALLRHARAERPPRHPHQRRGHRRSPRAGGGVQGPGARARAAVAEDPRRAGAVPSTKGSL